MSASLTWEGQGPSGTQGLRGGGEQVWVLFLTDKVPCPFPLAVMVKFSFSLVCRE